jgi:hypothetical protein
LAQAPAPIGAALDAPAPGAASPAATVVEPLAVPPLPGSMPFSFSPALSAAASTVRSVPLRAFCSARRVAASVAACSAAFCTRLRKPCA